MGAVGQEGFHAKVSNPSTGPKQRGSIVAGPSKVEFPGKKKQRIQMKGTKQANEATAKKLARDLGKFLDDPRSHLPAMTFTGKLRWGRTDPVSKTLAEIDKIIRKKDDMKWLAKRMMAKRGDDVAKAFAGSLHAAHDTEFTMVGQFNSGSFGGGSYVRRGDGKPGYMAGIQNFSNITLRMLPWEAHAKLGMYFFSWDGGFVCTGPHPEPPVDWLEDVLDRSRFSFERATVDGRDVWVTEGLEPSDVVVKRPSEQGYVALFFHAGQVVALGLDALQTFTKKDAPFIHHLALSMLPPLLPSVLDIDAVWRPAGWPDDRELPSGSTESIERILDAWQGLTMNEGVVGSAMKQSVMEGIEDGVLIGEQWLSGDDHGALLEALAPLGGSNEEHQLTAEILRLAVAMPHEDTVSLRIEAKGTAEQREDRCYRIMEGATCGDVLTAFWSTHGQEALAVLGLEGEEAEAIWSDQNDQPKPFGKFLKSLDQARALAQQRARFPACTDSGPAANIHAFLVDGLTKGMGSVERTATSRHDDVDSAAASWAWLVAVGRAGGQEWHFETNARDRGGVWAVPTKELHAIGTQLLDAEEGDVPKLQEAWDAAFAELKRQTGQ